MRAALSKIFTARPHGVALVLLTLIFLSLNLFSNLALRNARLDLTENGLFTLSDGTRNIVAGLQNGALEILLFAQHCRQSARLAG